MRSVRVLNCELMHAVQLQERERHRNNLIISVQNEHIATERDRHTLQESVNQAITVTYRRAARECHPDRNPNDTLAAYRFQLLAKAYSLLR